MYMLKLFGLVIDVVGDFVFVSIIILKKIFPCENDKVLLKT